MDVNLGDAYSTHYSLPGKSVWGPGRTGMVFRGGEELSLEPLRWGVGVALPGSRVPPADHRWLLGGEGKTKRMKQAGGLSRSVGKDSGDRETGQI